MLENEVAPDKASVCKYGYIEGGDGKYYRVARGGMNARGQKLDDLHDKIREIAVKEGSDRNETYSVARTYIITALEPFYDESRINELLDEGCFSWSDVNQVCRVVSGDDVIEALKKKDSSEKN